VPLTVIIGYFRVHLVRLHVVKNGKMPVLNTGEARHCSIRIEIG
jgi:hypothetical protein